MSLFSGWRLSRSGGYCNCTRGRCKGGVSCRSMDSFFFFTFTPKTDTIVRNKHESLWGQLAATSDTLGFLQPFFSLCCSDSSISNEPEDVRHVTPDTGHRKERCETRDSIKVRFSFGIVNDTARSYVAHLDGPCRGLVTMASVPALTPIRPHALPSLPFPSLLRVHPALVASRQNLPDAAAVCLLRCFLLSVCKIRLQIPTSYLQNIQTGQHLTAIFIIDRTDILCWLIKYQNWHRSLFQIASFAQQRFMKNEPVHVSLIDESIQWAIMSAVCQFSRIPI